MLTRTGSGRNGTMTPSGVSQVFERAASVGLPGLHPQRFRHVLAAWWLAAGGTEGDLMRLAGWKSRSMADRSAKAVAERPRPPAPGWASVTESGTPVQDRRRRDTCSMRAVAA
jgi:integrase